MGLRRARSGTARRRTSFWAGRRVFVTGHTGFKGSWLSLWLQQAGAELTGYALDPARGHSLFQAARVSKGMRDLRGDVRDLERLSAGLRRSRPEIAFHLAAQPLVRESYRNPLETYATNVMGTVNLLEAVRRTPGVRAVVVVTSDKCYENREWHWPYREDESLGGHDPYSSSKGCAELVTAAYRRSFFEHGSVTRRRRPPAVATARAGNVIGGGDWAADRLVPDCVRAILAGRPIVLRNPLAVRPWQHVLEPIGGYLRLAERLFAEGARFAQAFNFGPGGEDALQVSGLVERLVAGWGRRVRVRRQRARQPHEAGVLRLDCSKAAALLGWRPRLRLEDAVELTVAWYRDVAAGTDARRLTLEQIQRYQRLSETGPAPSSSVSGAR